MKNPASLDSLNDQALLRQFGDLVRRDHEGNADLLRHIDVIDQRKLWARLGHPSLFDFLVIRHHMSEATAFKRIGAARTARRFPILFELVGRGEIHLSGIHCLRAHLTSENYEHVLALAKHKTIREIEKLVAQLAPRPDVATTLRALPNRVTTAQTLAAAVPPTANVGALEAPAFDAPAAPALAPVPLPPRRDPDPEPLAPGRYKLTVTISENTRDKLKQLEDLLAHRTRKGDTAAILDRALDALLTQVKKRKIGITTKPRTPRVTQRSSDSQQTRHLAASVRREAWRGGDGRCGFVGQDGHHCNETRGLQFAHKKAWAKGGANTAENLGLRCPAHNALEADRDYGTGFMTHKSSQKQKPLKVREPLARYVPSGAPRATRADLDQSADPASYGVGSLERAQMPTDWVRSDGVARVGLLLTSFLDRVPRFIISLTASRSKPVDARWKTRISLLRPSTNPMRPCSLAGSGQRWHPSGDRSSSRIIRTV